jgi:hypothetical protein
MARKVFGVAALTALAGMIACSDPTGDLRNGAQRVYTNFSLSLVDLGKTTLVNARILDDQGNPLPGVITATSSNEAAVTVAEVDTFRPQLQDKLTRQFLVTTSALDSVLLTFSGGGVTGTTVVKVKPLSLPAVFSNTAPNNNDTVQVTAPPFKFTPATTVTYGGLLQPIVGFAADSTSVTFRVLTPNGTGALGPIRVVGAAPSYLLGAAFALNSIDSITAGPGYVGLTGTDAIATAPEIPMPVSGKSLQLSDSGTTFTAAECGNVGNHCRFYKLVVPADGTYDFTLNWGSTADFGGYFLDAAGNDLFGDFACDAHGSGASAHPESCTEDLVAGTYYFAMADFTAGVAQNTTYVIDIHAQ